MSTANPILVEVTRGQTQDGALAESCHRGAAAVVNSAGDVVHAWGDIDALVYPRSTLKPVQALPLLETGAADHFGIGTQEIALACASHNSEPIHVARVRAWLGRIGLGVDDLECGPSGGGTCESISLEVTKAMSRAGETFTRAHNNCSGKHTGFLTTALHMGEPTQGYIGRDHAVQRRVTDALEEMSGETLDYAPCSSDGCGIPVFAFPLVGLARAMARMTSDRLGRTRGNGVKRVLDAMTAHPDMVAGAKRFDTRIMQACKGTVLTKVGAEGVHAAIVPGKGLGVALKIDDGATRASELAMGCILDGLGALDDVARATIADLIEAPIRTTLGERVGEVRRGVDLKFD